MPPARIPIDSSPVIHMNRKERGIMNMRFSPLESLGMEQETFPQRVRRVRVPAVPPYPDVCSVCARSVRQGLPAKEQLYRSPNGDEWFLSRTWRLRVFH